MVRALVAYAFSARMICEVALTPEDPVSRPCGPSTHLPLGAARLLLKNLPCEHTRCVTGQTHEVCTVQLVR